MQLTLLYNLYIICTYKVKKSRICEMHCPEDCHTETYDTGISSALFPKETYARNTLMTLPPIFNRYAQEQVPLTYENLKTKVVAVDLFYSDMRYIEISEAGHTGVLGMVCQLGGVFGKFIYLLMRACILIDGVLCINQVLS